jgi:alkylation response protein AidB-like acyl-CoA dehydrogenase
MKLHVRSSEKHRHIIAPLKKVHVILHRQTLGKHTKAPRMATTHNQQMHRPNLTRRKRCQGANGAINAFRLERRADHQNEPVVAIHAEFLCDRLARNVPFLSMAKYYATELAVKVSGEALQMLGAAGYMQDHPTELYYRDAKQLTIVEGTTQVQLGLVARGVLDHDLWWD